MSSPLSSLGKHRRVPLQLQSPGKRTVSFKLSAHNEDEAMLLNDILSPRTQIPAQAISPSCSKGMATKASTQGAAPTDMELMSSMMQKIALLEQKVKSQAQELQLKTRKVAELEKQVKALQKGKDSPESSRTEELEVTCRQLQSQVWEMEQFLNDYGLIWVGERHEQLEELKSLTKQENQSSRSLWKPGNATVPKYRIDLDLILENLKELNVLAGEGVSRIEHTAGGARLRQPEAVSLTFYQNGIVMFNGPFRAYDEPATQQCLQDLMDGYFPSELQARYPEGVPFQRAVWWSWLQVTDRRDVFFRERQLSENFPGQGQVVGHSRSSEVKETSEIPGPKLSLEQFLNKLPKSLVRKGHVIDIRGPIKETLQGSAGTRSNEVILVETPSLGALKERLKAGKQDPSPAANISTLRIKSESGERTYIVTMLFTETIRDLRQHLAQARGGDVRPYEILSTFPRRVYADSSMTLQQCGLVPNASLLLREKLPSATERRPASDERLGTSHQAVCCPPTQPLSSGALCTGKGEVQPRPS